MVVYLPQRFNANDPRYPAGAPFFLFLFPPTYTYFTIIFHNRLGWMGLSLLTEHSHWALLKTFLPWMEMCTIATLWLHTGRILTLVELAGCNMKPIFVETQRLLINRWARLMNSWEMKKTLILLGSGCCWHHGNGCTVTLMEIPPIWPDKILTWNRYVRNFFLPHVVAISFASKAVAKIVCNRSTRLLREAFLWILISTGHNITP